MNALLPESTETIARLKAALGSGAMPMREAESCSLLLDRLTRPVRVGVFGLSTGGDAWLLDQLLGERVLPEAGDWPTLEVVHGPKLVTHATYEDGLTTSFQGRATEAVLSEEPVFLRIEAPLPTLTRMRFLYLATDDAARDQIAALDWAEPRTDIAIWATHVFDQAEIAIWAHAPDGLKNHALLVSTSARQDLDELTSRAGYEFDGVYAVPDNSDDPRHLQLLLTRLEDDIADARVADLDAAHVFLHRLGHLVPEQATLQPVSRPVSRPVSIADVPTAEAATPPKKELWLDDAATPAAAPVEPAPAPQPEPVLEEVRPAPAPRPEPAPQPVAQEIAPAPVEIKPAQPERVVSKPAAAPIAAPAVVSPEMQAMLSEPILYLKRRARALLELVEWQAAEEAEAAEDWAGEVLSHCCETTEGLQMRAMDWPEDEACALTLRRTLDEACDVAILLQVEGGKDQAQDAAMMLLQLRGDFERELAA